MQACAIACVRGDHGIYIIKSKVKGARKMILFRRRLENVNATQKKNKESCKNNQGKAKTPTSC